MIYPEIEFKQAWIGHRKFKTQLRQYLAGSSKDIATITDHQGCSLNTWLKEVAVQYQISGDSLLEASYLHESVHQEAGRVIKMHQLNRTDEAQAQLTEIEAMDDEILAALEGVLREIAA